MTKIDDKYLDELMALSNAAAPGFDSYPTCRWESTTLSLAEAKSFNKFIVAAKESVPKLIAEIRRLQAPIGAVSFVAPQYEAAVFDRARRTEEAEAELAENEGVIRVWRGRTERAEAEVSKLKEFIRTLGSTRHALEPCAATDLPCPHKSHHCTAAGIVNAAFKREFK